MTNPNMGFPLNSNNIRRFLPSYSANPNPSSPPGLSTGKMTSSAPSTVSLTPVFRNPLRRSHLAKLVAERSLVGVSSTSMYLPRLRAVSMMIMWTFNSTGSSHWDGLRHFGYQKERLYHGGVGMEEVHREGAR